MSTENISPVGSSKSVVDDSPDMHRLLKARYAGHAWAFCFEVPDGTSSHKSRTIDALAMGCWKSEGIHLHGHEIKHSRADWLKELDSPSKQTTWLPYLHKFWIVAVRGIVKPEELPAEWGLMENRGAGLKVSKAASLLQPLPVPHSMLAAIMRRVLLASPSGKELNDEYRRGFDSGKIAGDNTVTYEYRIKAAEQSLEKFKATVAQFERDSGIEITGWNRGNVGQQFRAFQELDRGKWDECLRVAKQFVAAAESCR